MRLSAAVLPPGSAPPPHGAPTREQLRAAAAVYAGQPGGPGQRGRRRGRAVPRQLARQRVRAPHRRQPDLGLCGLAALGHAAAHLCQGARARSTASRTSMHPCPSRVRSQAQTTGAALQALAVSRAQRCGAPPTVPLGDSLRGPACPRNSCAGVHGARAGGGRACSRPRTQSRR